MNCRCFAVWGHLWCLAVGDRKRCLFTPIEPSDSTNCIQQLNHASLPEENKATQQTEIKTLCRRWEMSHSWLDTSASMDCKNVERVFSVASLLLHTWFCCYHLENILFLILQHLQCVFLMHGQVKAAPYSACK